MNWLRKFFSFREKRDEGDVVKPFLDHLEDLRVTVMKMAAVLIAGMFVSFFYASELTHIVITPLHTASPDTKIITTDLTQGFMVSLKLAFYAGIILTFPILLYFVAEFVLPALTRREKRMLLPTIASGFVLFVGGVVLAYYFLLPRAIQWFVEYSKGLGFDAMLDAGKYFGFVTHLLLACGLLCELPVVILALSALGLVSYGLLSSTRPWAYTLILVVVALISPTPDPFSFVALAVPVLAIYEMCIWMVYFMERRRRRREMSPQTIPE
jgi:sec-independent protein translocase protein TatC